MLMTTRNRALYQEAVYCALHALMSRAAARGRGWYHYNEGELIVGTRIALDGGES